MLSKDELEAYCKKYYLMVYKYCMSRLSNKEDAEDVTQATFEIFSRKGSLLEDNHIQAWLFTVAHKLVLKEYRKRYNERNIVSDWDDETTNLNKKIERLEDDFIDCYIEKYTDEIYSRLTSEEKKLFDLYSDGNMKTGQIAKLLGIEPHACSMRKKRLIEKCRKIMLELLFF